MGISGASTSTPNQNDTNDTNVTNEVFTPKDSQGDVTITQEDPEASPTHPPKAPKILVEATQSQIEQQGTQNGTKMIGETPERNDLRELYAKSLAEDWNNRCAYCTEVFHQPGSTKKGKIRSTWSCEECKREYDTHPEARCTLDHVKGWPPHCRAHHHYHMFGKLFEEVDTAVLTIRVENLEELFNLRK